MTDIFSIRDLNYDLRSQTDLFINTVNTTKFSLDLLRYFASKVWNMISIEIKNSTSVDIFRNKINMWKSSDCDCKLYQEYLYSIGYNNLADN